MKTDAELGGLLGGFYWNYEHGEIEEAVSALRELVTSERNAAFEKAIKLVEEFPIDTEADAERDGRIMQAILKLKESE